MEATSPLPEVLVLETTLGLGGRPPLDAAFVAVCDTVLMAWKGERRSPLPTLLSDSAFFRILEVRRRNVSNSANISVARLTSS